MSLLDSSVGLIYTLKAESDTTEIKKFEAETDNLTGKLGSASGGFLSLLGSINPVSLATTAASAIFTAAAASAVTLATTLFDLAKNASDFGSEIFDAQQKTGLAAESLSSMKYAAEQSGTSFEAVSSSTSKFSKLLGDAAKGSEEAKAKLKALGVTSTDLDTALGQAYKTINGLPEGFQQMTAAQDAFGKSGADLLPYIRSFDGDLEGLKATAKKLGVTLTEEDIRAADAFGDSLDTMSTQAKVAAARFALQFAPVITDVMNDTSKALSDNKENFQKWGSGIGDVARGIRSVFQSEMAQTIASIAAATFKLSGFYQLEKYILNKLRAEGKEQNQNQESSFGGAAGGKGKVSDIDTSYTDNFGGGKSGKSAEDLRNKQLDAQIKGFELDINLAKAEYENYKKKLDELLKGQAITLDAYRANLFANITEFEGKIDAFYNQKLGVINQRFKGAELSNAVKELDLAQKNLKAGIDEDSEKAVLDNRERRLKSKEVENKQLLDLEKSKAEKSIAENEKLFVNQEISEQEFLKRKEKSTVDLLRFEKKQVEDFDGFLARLLTEEADYRKLSEEDLLKNNDLHKELESRRLALKSQIQKAETEAAINETKRRTEITDAIEKQSEAAKIQGNENFDKSQREFYERELSRGKNRLQNLIDYRNFEVNQIETQKQEVLDKLDAEKEAQLKSIEGFTNEQELKFQIEEVYKQRRLVSEEEFQARLDEIKRKFDPQIDQADDGFFGTIKKGINELFSAESLQNASGALVAFGNLAVGVFQGMANAVGSAISQWTLYGGSVGQALKKALAAELAHVAGVATVNALYATALGFMRLAHWDFVGAGHAFMSAGLWAALAGGTALAARALSGNQNQATNAFGQAANSSPASGNNSGNRSTNDAYSGAGDKVTTYESGLNSPAQIHRHEIKVGSREFVINTIKNDAKGNGDLRDLFRELAGQN